MNKVYEIFIKHTPDPQENEYYPRYKWKHSPSLKQNMNSIYKMLK